MSNMKHVLQITSLLCLLPIANIAVAHTDSAGYVYDARALVRDSYGNCVRTGEWTEANALRECDPQLFKEVVAPAPKPAPVVVAPPPPPAPVVIAPPPPPPVVVAPPPKPAPVKVNLSADESFDTGKADLKASGKEKLSQFAKDLQAINYDTVTVTGHADRTGKAATNQTLSEKRASAVREYLVSQNIPANKISSSGKGSSEPVTKPGDCAKLKGKKLGACLAPDRRVEVDVSGTRAK